MDTLLESKKGEIVVSDNIVFENVPILSPNGDVLIQAMNFSIKPGMNLFITGPNGCGKSSLFRILGELWPVFGGRVQKPAIDQIFYIPQRPYLPKGTLRDQIIYPHTKEQMARKGVNEEKLQEIINEVKLENLATREGGWDASDN